MLTHLQQASSFLLHNIASLRVLLPSKSATISSQDDSLTTSTTSTVTHLIVLIHGLNGAPSDLQYLAQQLSQALPAGSTHCHCTAVNSTSRYSTHDGVDVGGQRVYDDIVSVIQRLKQSGSALQYISVVGHSLGGLYARYAITQLHAHNSYTQCSIQPLVFLTLATPHLGIYELHWVMQWGASYVIGQTGKQLVLKDGSTVQSDSDSSVSASATQPLLLQMSTGHHLTALQQFKHHILYSNITGDLSVGYCTASLRSSNPYTQLSNAELLKLVLKEHDYVVDEQLWREVQQRQEQHKQHDELAHCPAHLQSTVQTMLRNLTSAPSEANHQRIAWHRYDVVGRLGLAHTDIVVRSELLNLKYGKSTVAHIVKQFVECCNADGR